MITYGGFCMAEFMAEKGVTQGVTDFCGATVL